MMYFPVLGDAGKQLQALNGFSAGIQNHNACVFDDDDDDIPLSLEEGKWGYFDKHSGRVEVGIKAVTQYRFQMDWLPFIIRRDLEIPPLPGTQVWVENCFWYLGQLALNAWKKAPLFLARRLSSSQTWAKVYEALQQRSGLEKGLILTTSETLPVGYSIPGQHEVLPIETGLACGSNQFHLDRAILKAKLTDSNLTKTNGPFSADYRKAYFGDTVYDFTPKQAAFIEILHKQGRMHKHQLMVAIGSKQDNPVGIFRTKGQMHPAWGILIQCDNQGYYWLEY